MSTKTADGGDSDSIHSVIQSILGNKKKILEDPDLATSVADMAIFDSLVTKFEQLDRRSDETEGKKSAYAAQRDSNQNKLIFSLLEMMKNKIELFENEMAIAEKIQKNLLPDKVPEIPGYEFEAYYAPSKHVSGDYYDFYQPDKERLYFLIADVSGHGVPSSLIVASMQAYLCAQIQEQKSLNAMIENLNDYLIETTLSSKFVTLFIGVIELSTGSITYINAGHNPPYIIGADNEVRELTGGGPLLGMFENTLFSSGRAQLHDGEILVLFTDGVVEAMNREEEEFSEERFIKVIQREGHETLIKIMLQLFKEVRLFCDGVPYGDDITICFIRKTEVKTE
ncbi:PP2C family protein-serine/threonine phosphatase [candidate division KSB1 bacterium]